MKANQVLERCSSTSDLARKLGEAGLPQGTWISARIQDAGRGRMGRRWESLRGNLFLSMIARVEDRSLWTWVPLTAAVAVVRALNNICEVNIKWPNDLWSGEAKMGGILCEAVNGGEGAFIIIGLGLNCEQAPEGLDQPATSVTRASGRRVSADDIRPKVVAVLREELDRLAAEGRSALTKYVMPAYERAALLAPGTEIEWNVQETGSTLHGRVEGLGESGELRVRDPQGKCLKLYAEDVRVRAVPKASGGSPA